MKSKATMIATYHKSGLICLMIMVIVLIPGIACGAKSQKTVGKLITIKAESGQNIRDISETYLNDPDLWEDILRANHLKTADEVRSGMVLHIPVEPITQANRELEHSKDLLREATEAGARVFAPRVVAKAIQFRDIALEKRKQGEWSACSEHARSAADEAKKALEISIENQDVPAEAVVDFSQGQVHKRKPSDNLWKDVSRYDVLLEGEKIRTLSQSFADILFRDNSRLQLRENAQAMIRKMRANLLEDVGEAKITLIKGDVLALLSGGKAENQFQLEVEGVEANIKSRRFRAGHDDEKEVSWFAVDEGEVEIKAKGKKVVLKKNQGSVVPRNQKPSEPRELLLPPRLLDPPDGEERFDLNTALIWERVGGAGTYLLELSDNASFAGIAWSGKIQDTGTDQISSKYPGTIGSGAFYWRVTAISPDKLPGRVSKVRFIRIIDDKVPPFLVIDAPRQGSLLSENTVEISGTTEGHAAITIQDHAVEADAGGKYKFRYELSEGQNHIVVTATDRAGNIRQLERTVTFVPAGKIDLTFDAPMQKIGDNRFLVRHQNFTLSGKTYPKGMVTITSVPKSEARDAARIFSAATLADEAGHFQMNAWARGEQDTFAIEVVTQAGEVKKTFFGIEIDNIPPIIRFTEEIPFATSQKELWIRGVLEGGVSLRLNRQKVPLEPSEDQVSDFRFQHLLVLSSGTNRLLFAAHDMSGNISVIEKEIHLDLSPPEFVNYQVSPQKAKGGEKARILLRVRDETGLMRTARFVAQVGEFTHTGLMMRSTDTGEYVGWFSIPKTAKGKTKLKTVTVSDYLGNSKNIVFRK